MKVLHVTHYARGGIVTLILNQIRYSRNQDVQYGLALFDKFDADLWKLGESHHIPIYFLQSNKFLMIGSLVRYAALIRRFSPDVLHTHSYFPRLLTGILTVLGLTGGRRVVTTIHNDYPYFHKKDVKSGFKRLTEKAAIRAAGSRVVCVSQDVRHVVGRLYNNSTAMTVINNGVHLPKKEDHPLWRNRSGDRIVVTVGRLSRQKNYGLLLDCWPEVHEKYPKAELWIVGDGEERASLEAKARNSNMHSSVRFMGWQHDVGEFLKRASIFVLSSDHEGFPVAVLEAQSHGLPVIATDVSGVSEIIENGVNGIVIERDNKVEMVKALLMLMGDDDRRVKIGTIGQLSVYSKFSIDTYTQKVESLYYELV